MGVEPGSDLGPELVDLLQHDWIVKDLSLDRLAARIHLGFGGEVVDQLVEAPQARYARDEPDRASPPGCVNPLTILSATMASTHLGMKREDFWARSP